MQNIWWNKVTNAVLFLDLILANVEDKKNIILLLPDYVPWYNEMCESIEIRFYEANLSRTLDFLDDVDIEEPGEILLKNYCKSEKRDEYRPSIGYAQFLGNAENVVLNERIVWVKNIDKSRESIWIKFVSDYSKAVNKKNGAIFILEFRGEEEDELVKKGFSYISYKDRINPFDTYVFNMLLASSISKNTNIKKYFSELITSLVEDDVELAQLCVSDDRFNIFISNPNNAIKDVIKNEVRSDGKMFCYDFDEDEIEYRVWRAQIKIIFPIIEEFRGRFIDKHKVDIEKELPLCSTYGEKYNHPNEVELGTLYFMASNGIINLSPHQLHELKMYRDARNDLAHLSCLNIRVLEQILSSK